LVGNLAFIPPIIHDVCCEFNEDFYLNVVTNDFDKQHTGTSDVSTTTQPMDTEFPVFDNNTLDIAEVSMVLKKFGGFFVKNFLSTQTLSELDDLQENYFKKWKAWEKEYVENSGFRIITPKLRGEARPRNSKAAALLENLLSEVVDPVVYQWQKVMGNLSIFKGDLISSETNFLKGPNVEPQAVHMDTLIPTFNFIAYLTDAVPTQIVDYSIYGISFEDIQNDLEKNIKPEWFEAEDSYNEDFSISFLKKYFPCKVGCLCSDPVCFKIPNMSKGDALFFDGRLLHFGPSCGEDRLILFRNWVRKDLLKYHKNTQFRGDELLRLIHFLDDVGSQEELYSIPLEYFYK